MSLATLFPSGIRTHSVSAYLELSFCVALLTLLAVAACARRADRPTVVRVVTDAPVTVAASASFV